MAYNAISHDVLQHIQSDEDFNALASEAFAFQSERCAPFQTFLKGIGSPSFTIEQPAFLPIELFKTHKVFTGSEVRQTFLSSGTEASGRSTHAFADLDIYRHCSVAHFESIYGALSNHRILALLPSYLEQGASSLVFMVNHFMRHARQDASDFFLYDFEALKTTLNQEFEGSTLLIGVSYALLDFAETSGKLPAGTIVMETGGMKGRKRELTREELHGQLSAAFGLSEIHSEYGMTELSSQAYSTGDGWFITPPWMKAYTTEVSDPLRQLPAGRRGCLAFIDLANRDSCAFIQTRDIGVVREDGAFRVEGRMDRSDLRGCNLLYT